MLSCINELPEEQREYLYSSWAGVFYQEFFCRVDEKPFAVLYSNLPSRPNVPVNVLVGLEYLKAGNGWTDQEKVRQSKFGVSCMVKVPVE